MSDIYSIIAKTEQTKSRPYGTGIEKILEHRIQNAFNNYDKLHYKSVKLMSSKIICDSIIKLCEEGNKRIAIKYAPEFKKKMTLSFLD